MADLTNCTRPPEGWRCTRKSNHSGPCAAVPIAYDNRGNPVPEERTDECISGCCYDLNNSFAHHPFCKRYGYDSYEYYDPIKIGPFDEHIHCPHCEMPISVKWTRFDGVEEYDPEFGDHRRCVCGHPYYRHFDTYDDMYPIGCKYCGCYRFEEGPESKNFLI